MPEAPCGVPNARRGVDHERRGEEVIVGRRLVSGNGALTGVQTRRGRRHCPVPRPAVADDELTQVVAPAHVVSGARAVENPAHHMTGVMLSLPVVTGKREERVCEPPESGSQLLAPPATDLP